VAKVAIVKSFPYVVGPFLQLGGVDFHRGAADPTREMVVVRLDDASSVQALSAVGHDDVDFTVFDQFFQLRIDRRERNPPTVSFDESVEFLGAHKALQLTEDAENLSPLHGISGRSHDIHRSGCRFAF